MDDKRSDISEAAQTLSELGSSKGGKARALALSKEDRQEIARRAAQARWGSSIIRATHGSPDRPLKIGALEIPCYVLADGRRVLHQRGMVSALGMSRGGSSRGGGDRLAYFTAQKTLEPFVSAQLLSVTKEPIKFLTPRGQLAYGYEATVLADICEAILEARKMGVLQKQQHHIAAQSEILVRGFARVGIIALVDEATGYQADRGRDELNKILEAYISKELLPWTKRFPDEFFKQLYRLRRWDYREGSHKRYRVVGKLVNKLVYEPLPPGVLAELKHKNPQNEKGYRQFKHHQFLTPDIGNEHLKNQLLEVITLMKVSIDQAEFERLFNKAFPRPGEALQMDFAYSGTDNSN